MRAQRHIRTALLAATTIAVALAASGCGQRGPAAAEGKAMASDAPRVPFAGKPCESLSLAEQRAVGFAKPGPGESKRIPDRLPLDNVCEWDEQDLEYDAPKSCAYQRSHLRSPSRAAPTDVPGAFYDVLGNLWFEQHGYCAVLANNVAGRVDRERAARVIASKW